MSGRAARVAGGAPPSATRAAIVAAVACLLALPCTAGAQTAAGGPKPVVGGGSFNNAPLLAPGDYTDTVAAGETVYWKVHLEKGQVLRVKATVDTSQVQTDPTKPDWETGLYHLDYRLDIFSPLRERLSGESGGGYDTATASMEGDPEAGEKSGTATGPRVLGYEQLLASDYDKNVFPAPGEWYVSVSAADFSYYPAEFPLELPVDLNVQVLGTAQPSSPDFAKALPGPQKQQPSAPTPSQGSVADLLATADQPADPALTIALVGAIALVGGLLLGALAFVLLRPGRRQPRP
jgi:Ca-activated chloride channel family protein